MSATEDVMEPLLSLRWQQRAWRGLKPSRMENGAMALAMAGLVILPLTGIVLRPLVHSSLDGGGAIVQHLVAPPPSRLEWISGLRTIPVKGRMIRLAIASAMAPFSIRPGLRPRQTRCCHPKERSGSITTSVALIVHLRLDCGTRVRGAALHQIRRRAPSCRGSLATERPWQTGPIRAAPAASRVGPARS